MVNTNKNISHHVISWYNANKRLLSFRDTKDPYKIWLSEIMLQQTTESTVLPYYEKWIIKDKVDQNDSINQMLLVVSSVL